MTINTFTTGRDVSITLTLPGTTGTTTTAAAATTINGLTHFKADPMTTKLESQLITGSMLFGVIPKGWKGSFKLDRLDHSIDDFWAAFEAAYYAGTAQTAGTIQEIIKEADGTTTTWQYSGVILTLEDAGDYSGDKKVEQTITFEASTKTKVS